MRQRFLAATAAAGFDHFLQSLPHFAVTSMSPLTCCHASGPDHIVLRCKDPATSAEWYHNTLGLQPVRLEELKTGLVPFPSVRVSPTFLIGAGMFCFDAAAPGARPAQVLSCCAMYADFFKQQENDPPEAAHLPSAGSTARRNTGRQARNPWLHHCAVLGVEAKRKRPQLAACYALSRHARDGIVSGVTCVPPCVLCCRVDHFCLVVQEHDIEGVRQQLAAAGIEAEAQFDGVVVKRFGTQGNARSIYIRDPGVC